MKRFAVTDSENKAFIVEAVSMEVSPSGALIFSSLSGPTHAFAQGWSSSVLVDEGNVPVNLKKV